MNLAGDMKVRNKEKEKLTKLTIFKFKILAGPLLPSVLSTRWSHWDKIHSLPFIPLPSLNFSLFPGPGMAAGKGEPTSPVAKIWLIIATRVVHIRRVSK